MNSDHEHDVRRVQTYCALCISRCGCIAVLDQGRLIGIEPDPAHPTGRSLCIKGRAAPELVYHPDRLMQPLRRTTRKGEPPGWQPLSWEAALDLAAERLLGLAQEHGPEAVAFAITTPSGTAVADGMNWLFRLANAFGTPNVLFTTHVCNWHRDNATRLTTGADIGMPDFERASCLFLWGFNPSATWPAFGERLAAARARGMKLVVVDPRRAGLAGKADVWLPVRPGTDGALALALAGELIAQGRFDQEFLRTSSNAAFLVRDDDGCILRGNDGPLVWDASAACAVAQGQAVSPSLHGEYLVDGIACRPAFALFAQLCREMPPERAATLTGVPAADIRRAASLLAEAGPAAAYYAWAGVNQGVNVTQTSRALSILFAMTGGFDAPGGNRQWAKPALRNVQGRELLAAEQRAKTLGLRERPLGPAAVGMVTEPDLYRAMCEGEPYPVRALLSFGSNLLATRPDPARARAALGGLDFHVHADLFVNETASFADLLLPVASAWERGGLCAGFQLDRSAAATLQWRSPLVSPPGEARSDTWIAFELAKRLGLAEHFFDGDAQAALTCVLEPSGVTLDELLRQPGGIELTLLDEPFAYRRQGFATPSGLLEIYSEALLTECQSPLPDYLPPAETDDVYPLLFTSAKSVPYCHSQYRGMASLLRRQPQARVEVHPNTAAACGVSDGQTVEVRSPNGQVVAHARLSAAIAEGVLCIDYGWEGEANYAQLVGLETMDPVSGSLPLRGGVCSLRPAHQ